MKIPLVRGRSIAVFATFAGKRRTREIQCVLDTGATLTLIPVEDALGLGYDLTSAPMVALVTASGLVEAPKIFLREVRLGAFCVEDVEAVCHNMPRAQVSALLGLSFLERCITTIDYKAGVLEIIDP